MSTSIYGKPTRLLMKDFVKENDVVKGQIISRDQVIAWFKEKYPKIKKGTISAHLLRMSINAPSRIHYSVSTTGEDDLFFQLDSGHFRLYDSEKDSAPIYIGAPGNKEEEVEAIESDDEDHGSSSNSGFAFESDLRDFLSKNLHIIEPGLRLYEEEGITGVEFPAGGRFIDILAVDQKKNYVVIELKVSRGHERVIGQILRYIGWIEKYQAEPGQKARGIIVAREISEDLILASSKVSDVTLFEYDLSVSLRRINNS